MSDKCDLARMLREISEETAVKRDAVKALSQDEIKRLVVQRKKKAGSAQAGRPDAN